MGGHRRGAASGACRGLLRIALSATGALAVADASAEPAARAGDGDSRRGPFLGGAFAGGFSTSRGEPEAAMRFGARAGLGLGRVTLDLAPGYAAIMADGRGSTLRIDAAANLYALRRFYLRAGGGLAAFLPDRGDALTGVAVIGGAGVELFSDDRWASGVGLSYEPEFYDRDDVWHQVLATVTITRY